MKHRAAKAKHKKAKTIIHMGQAPNSATPSTDAAADWGGDQDGGSHSGGENATAGLGGVLGIVSHPGQD